MFASLQHKYITQETVSFVYQRNHNINQVLYDQKKQIPDWWNAKYTNQLRVTFLTIEEIQYLWVE